MGGSIVTRAGVGAGETIVYTNKSLSSPLTRNRRRKGKGGSLKECNISRHKVTSKNGTITPILFLNMRITHKDTL